LTVENHPTFFASFETLASGDEQLTAAAHWAESLTTAEQLESALAALLSLESDERANQLVSLGPALLSQWGRIAPAEGLLAWAKLAHRDRELLANVGAKQDWPVTPTPLLDSWAASDPDGFFENLINSEQPSLSGTLQQLGFTIDQHEVIKRFFAHQEVDDLINRLDLMPIQPTSKPTPRGGNVMEQESLMQTLVSDKLVRQHGDIEAAIQAVQERPPSPTRDLVHVDLMTSNWVRMGLDQMGVEGLGEFSEEVRTRFLKTYQTADERGKRRIEQTLREEAMLNMRLTDSGNWINPVVREFQTMLQNAQ
jgi:hypothetical protein